MIDLINEELIDAKQYLNIVTVDYDRAVTEGRIIALEWVLKRLPEEG